MGEEPGVKLRLATEKIKKSDLCSQYKIKDAIQIDELLSRSGTVSSGCD
jgi:hypothetical protein